MFKSSFSLVLLTTALFCSGVSAQGRVDSISSAVSSKCLQVRGSKFVNGTAVESYDCNGSTSQWQKWKISPGSTEVKVAGPCPGAQFCLDANKIATNSRVVIRQCNKQPSQQWNYTSSGLLKLAGNSNLCLDVPYSSKDNGVQVQVYPCHGGPNQVWKLV